MKDNELRTEPGTSEMQDSKPACCMTIHPAFQQLIQTYKHSYFKLCLYQLFDHYECKYGLEGQESDETR